MGLIYKSTNIINNKIYIGLTTRTLETRKKEHFRDMLREDKFSIFHKAILKYGKENFKWEIIEICDNNIIEEREIFHIKEQKSFAGEYESGYNLTKGGVCNFGCVGENHWINRFSEVEREKWLNENRRGENNGMFGKGDRVSGENHFSKKMSIEEKEKWLKNISGKNNYQKNMTKNELKEKCWINNINEKEKVNYINTHLKGKNNPFYKRTKEYVILFPNNDEYIIKIVEFCKDYKEIKLHPSGLYTASHNNTKYKGYGCRLKNDNDSEIKQWVKSQK